MPKILKKFLLALLILFLGFLIYFSVGRAKEAKNISWGVTFSQMQAENLGLDWKKTYSAIISDLGAKKIKLHTQWEFIEGKRGDFYFQDIDWQIKEAEKKGVKIIYVVGIKSGRWPECHLPEWAEGLTEAEQKTELLQYIREVVLRYKGSPAIAYWQAENEPFFYFGKCPWHYDKEFLKEEIRMIKSLDPARQVIVSDSGELSTWFDAADAGDILGITMYRRVWTRLVDGYGFYWTHVFPAISYHRKAQLIEKTLGKKVICVELQAEPWALKPFFDVPLEEQEKTMDLNRFKSNVEFAKATGLDEFYFWGVEWWYWLKTKHEKPEIWNEAKKLFIQSN